MVRRKKPAETFGKNVFGTNVLVGNWFEDRTSSRTDRHAITPCVLGGSSCVEAKSVLKSDFAPLFPKYYNAGTEHFIDWRLDGYHNRLKGKQTQIKLLDGKQFENNLTTTTDLMYRIARDKAKQDALATTDHKTHKTPKMNMLNSFGNQTNTGLAQYRKCLEWKEKREPTDVSITHWNYPAKSVKHIIAKKCENKPSLREQQMEFIRNELQKPEYCPKIEPQPDKKLKC